MRRHTAGYGTALTMEELGAIWRGCEVLEAQSTPMYRNGHVMKPLRRLVGDDDKLIGIREAADLVGLERKTFYTAYHSGALKREFPQASELRRLSELNQS